MLMRAIRWTDGRVVGMDETGSVIKDMTGKWDDLQSKYARDVEPFTELRHGDSATGATVMVDSSAFFTETTWKGSEGSTE